MQAARFSYIKKNGSKSKYAVVVISETKETLIGYKIDLLSNHEVTKIKKHSESLDNMSAGRRDLWLKTHIKAKALRRFDKSRMSQANYFEIKE